MEPGANDLPGQANVEPTEALPQPQEPAEPAGKEEEVKQDAALTTDASDAPQFGIDAPQDEVIKDDVYDDDDLDRQSDLGGEPDKEELETLLEILVEAFNEVDVENTGVISTEQLGTVMDGLVEEGVISEYTDEELEMLANDMDMDRNGYIPLEEFKDVLVRRQQGYDFTEIELKEAFEVFDVNSKNHIGARELRAVMQACCDIEVRALDGKKMIEAAASEPGQTTISLEEFKAIIRWKAPDDFYNPIAEEQHGPSEEPH
eukprot:CAMPEP_0184295382 /NCGR_PEP_ID=MMETSP1049-20130417/6234_1 /TAXON_ID=77928 /ORGANISM="Proteomonas sulcata, Strain CCMP704" /LENGTH=259 /DNA_ID=CAMNT_0026603859 /DNA_START=256 /DNA_END=1035 /DNA_ORIENTATION=-